MFDFQIRCRSNDRIAPIIIKKGVKPRVGLRLCGKINTSAPPYHFKVRNTRTGGAIRTLDGRIFQSKLMNGKITKTHTPSLVHLGCAYIFVCLFVRACVIHKLFVCLCVPASSINCLFVRACLRHP